MGLRCGFALDLTVPDENGEVWDFTKMSCRKKAWRKLKEERPYMLVGAPPCTAWSIIQNMNARTPEGKRKVDEAKKRALIHLQFLSLIHI